MFFSFVTDAIKKAVETVENATTKTVIATTSKESEEKEENQKKTATAVVGMKRK